MDEVRALRERAKELRCLYAVDAAITERWRTPGEVFHRVLGAIPTGWQRPGQTGARIEYLGRRYVGPTFSDRGALLVEPVRLWDTPVGDVTVSDASDAPGGFLPEEAELLRRIAARLGEYLERKHTELFGERRATSRDHWAWRERFADALADHIDRDRFGVSRIFLGGSTARGDAGPGSDIDLYVVFCGSEAQRRDLESWLEGWSLCLGQVALQHTGQPFPTGILNVRWLDRRPDGRERLELRELALRE